MRGQTEQTWMTVWGAMPPTPRRGGNVRRALQKHTRPGSAHLWGVVTRNRTLPSRQPIVRSSRCHSPLNAPHDAAPSMK